MFTIYTLNDFIYVDPYLRDTYFKNNLYILYVKILTLLSIMH